MGTIFIIPKMFTEEELRRVASELPDDFAQKQKEFWEYVRDRLNTQRNVRKLYYDSLVTSEREKALELIKQNHAECYNLVEQFVQAGATLEATEDPILIQEALSWASMLQEGKTDFATQEMLVKNMIDRDKYIARRISESLKHEESGILFLAPARRIDEYLPSDMRVIKIQPFDPADYLNSWIVSLSLKSKATPTTAQQS
jgi:hypothetical protein